MIKTETKKLSQVSEKIDNSQHRFFTEADFPVGTVSHQGDLILVRIKKFPKGDDRKTMQLAEGETQGSRHILDGTKKVIDPVNKSEVCSAIKAVCPKSNVQEYLIGPVFQGGTLTHPEHPWQTFPPKAIIAVVYQRNMDAEQREAKVRD